MGMGQRSRSRKTFWVDTPRSQKKISQKLAFSEIFAILFFLGQGKSCHDVFFLNAFEGIFNAFSGISTKKGDFLKHFKVFKAP